MKWSECNRRPHKPTLRDNIKHHKYVMHDGAGHGCDQCYNKPLK